MRRGFLLIILLDLIVGGLMFATAAKAEPGLTVYIKNDSSTVSDAALANALPAFQAAVSRDFAPYWSVDAKLVVTDTPPEGGWVIDLLDYTDSPGALGYHDGSKDLTPYARVFAATSREYKCSWQSVLTHELFEMLADPWIDHFAQGWHLWLIEVADPVEDAQFDYFRRGADGKRVRISDFVTPAWYRRIAKRGPFDFGRHVKRKGQVLEGGYASFLTGDTWNFIFG